MAESYISRRGGGVNMSSAIGIYSGSAPPSSGYGVWGSTTNTITTKVVTSNVLGTGGYYASVGAVSEEKYNRNFTANGNIIYGCGIYSIQRMWAYDTATNIYTINATGPYASRTMCLAYWEGSIVYSIMNGTSDSSAIVYSYDYSSGTTSSIVSIYGGYSFCGANRYENTVFIGGGATVVEAYKFSPSAKTVTLFYKEAIANPYDGTINGFLTFSGDICYFSGGYYSNNKNYTGCYLNMKTGSFGGTTHTGFPKSNGTQVVGGFQIGNYIYAFLLLSTVTYILDVTNISAGWKAGPALPFATPRGSHVTTGNGISINGVGYVSFSGNSAMVKFTPTFNTFNSNTMVIESTPSRTGNSATIYNDGKVDITIPVSGVYYSNGTTLTRLTAQTRATGGSWTAVP